MNPFIYVYQLASIFQELHAHYCVICHGLVQILRFNTDLKTFSNLGREG